MKPFGNFTGVRWRFGVAAFALASLLAPMQYLRAGDADEIDNGEEARLQQSGEILTSEQIQQRAHAEQSGEVTEIELKRKDGQYAYEVDIVDDLGVKHELTFNAKTGEYLAREEDDEDGENDNSDDDEN